MRGRTALKGVAACNELVAQECFSDDRSRGIGYLSDSLASLVRIWNEPFQGLFSQRLAFPAAASPLWQNLWPFKIGADPLEMRVCLLELVSPRFGFVMMLNC